MASYLLRFAKHRAIPYHIQYSRNGIRITLSKNITLNFQVPRLACVSLVWICSTFIINIFIYIWCFSGTLSYAVTHVANTSASNIFGPFSHPTLHIVIKAVMNFWRISESAIAIKTSNSFMFILVHSARKELKFRLKSVRRQQKCLSLYDSEVSGGHEMIFTKDSFMLSERVFVFLFKEAYNETDF